VHLSLALRSNGTAEVEERKREGTLRAMDLGLPVFGEIAQQARTIAAVHAYETFLHSRGLAVAN